MTGGASELKLRVSVSCSSDGLMMDYVEERFKRQGVLNAIMREIRVTNPGSDFRKTERPQEQRKLTQSLPPPRQNGYLVTSEPAVPTTQDRMTYYQTDAHGGPLKANNSPTRRQQSLPSRSPGGQEKQRQANSAPSRKNRSHSHGAPLPKLNTLVARSRGPGGETNHIVTTSFAGYSTRDQDANHQKSTKFASTWAQVRAENHIDICTSPDGSPKHDGPDEDNSRDKSIPRKRQQHTTSPERNYSTSPERNHLKGDHQRYKTSFAFDASSRDKENVEPDSSAQKKESVSGPAANTPQSVPKKSKQEREKQTIRFVTPEDELKQEREEDEDVRDGDDVTDSPPPDSRETKKRKPRWNNSVAVVVPQPRQPTVTSWRRYEAELTHMPHVTSTKQVYKAYTGRSKQQLREGALNTGDDTSAEPQRPSTKGSSETNDGNEFRNPDSRPKKEHILTRNEAKMYIHLQNVYGSEAFRQQRKEWFFKKLSDVQVQELKEQAEEKRQKGKQREESKKRQQRQLNYVRRKFRREQLHRFRTQYVTSRVLEYEKADRDIYGLPDDSDDEDDDFGDLGFGPVKTANTQPDKTSAGDGKKNAPQGSDKDTGDVSNQSRFANGRGSSEEASGEKIVQGVGVSDAKERDAKQNDASQNDASQNDTSHKPVNRSPGESNAKKHNSVSQSTEQRPSQNQPTNNRNETSKPVLTDNSKQTQPKTTANKDKNMVKNKTSTETEAESSGSRSDIPNNTKTTPATVQTKKVAFTNNTDDDAQSANSSNTVTNANSTGKQNESSTLDRSSGANTKPVQDKQDSKQVNATKGAVTNIPANDTNSVLRAENPSSTTNNKQDDNTNAVQKTNGTTHRSDANKSSATNVPEASVKSTSGDESKSKLNPAKPAESSNSSSPKTTLPAEQKPRTETKPQVSDSNGVQSRHKDTRTSDGLGKRTTITKDAKGRYITTTKNFGPSEYPSRPANDHTVNGQSPNAKETSNRDVSNKPTPGTGQTSPERQPMRDARDKPLANRQTDSRGRRRKTTQAQQPRSEAEQKQQLERKYGKMFDVKTGPSWNPGAKQPKMEGIDTVYVRVTDEKGDLVVDDDGRTKLKKREVKAVVKEAKNQLAAPDPESPRGTNAAAKKGGQQSQLTEPVRPASADTLDFDDDDDDDEEDVFERVRRKYDLQIDSDDDNLSRT